jgi:hypothetical protein
MPKKKTESTMMICILKNKSGMAEKANRNPIQNGPKRERNAPKMAATKKKKIGLFFKFSYRVGIFWKTLAAITVISGSNWIPEFCSIFFIASLNDRVGA